MKEQGVGLKRYRPSDYDEEIGPRSEAGVLKATAPDN